MLSFLKRKRPASDTEGDRAASSTSTEVFWPLDLLAADIKNVRILTYGYDSHISRFFKGSANQNNIFAHGQDLLNALERARRKSTIKRIAGGDPKRPIIFVVHSLGGIVLKEVCPFEIS